MTGETNAQAAMRRGCWPTQSDVCLRSQRRDAAGKSSTHHRCWYEKPTGHDGYVPYRCVCACHVQGQLLLFGSPS
jgi:hypothetical protein